MSTVVILDSNAIGRLAAETAQSRVLAALRVTGATLWLSAINVLETLKTENDQVRLRLLGAVSAMSDGRPLLPLPMQLLKQVTNAVMRGQPGFSAEPSGVEWLLRNPDGITAEQRAVARELLAQNQAFWDARYRAGRRGLRDLLRRHGAGDPWGSVTLFLEEHWMSPQVLGGMVERMLRELRCEPDIPLDVLLQEEPWRLYLESMGAAIYERCILNQPPSPVHIPDLLQLVYLGGSAQRILVTDDAGLRRVSQGFIVGRYTGARIMTTTEFLSAAA